MKVYKNGEFIGPKISTNELFKSGAKYEKNRSLTFSVITETKGESWSVSFDPSEVEMIIRKLERLDEMTYQELAGELNRDLEERKKQSQRTHDS